MRYIVILMLLVGAAAGEVQEECPWNPAFPFYPQIARAARVEGTVKLKVAVDEAGKPTASLIKGHPMLVQTSFDVVERWTFTRGKARTFSMRFIYHLFEPNGKGAANASCAVSKFSIDFPNVEIWAPQPVLNVSSDTK